MTKYFPHIICLENELPQPIELKSEAGSFVGSDNGSTKIGGLKHLHG